MNKEIPKQTDGSDLNNSLSFSINKKLAIILFVGLFFLAFGVGAYYLGRQSVTNLQTPYLTPTSSTIQPSIYPTIYNQISPTISSTRNLDVDCVMDSDCPRAYASYGQRCVDGKCVMDEDDRSTYPVQSSCTSNNDCVLKQTPYCCGEKKESYNSCFNKNENPPDISCKGVGYCDSIIGNATSCSCDSGKCVAHF